MSCSARLAAQLEQSVFSSTGRASATTFVTDYQCIGINPSNLGWQPRYEGKRFALGFAEVGLSIWSPALSKDEIRDQFLKTDKQFTEQERRDAAIKMAEQPLTINGDVTLMGLAWNSEKIGGFGFSIHDRAQWNSSLNSTFSDILFRGYQSGYFDQWVLTNGDTVPNLQNVPPDLLAQVVAGISSDPTDPAHLFNGTMIKFNWYREYNLSYGRQLIGNDVLRLYAGVGLKYLSGMGIIDLTAANGNIQGFAAMSPYFNVDYGGAQTTPIPDSDRHFPPKQVGSGTGFDIGFSATVLEKFKFGASLNNIGSITWSGNTYRATDLQLATYAFTGINNYNVFNNIDNIIGVHSPVEWQSGGTRSVALPSVLRIGAGARLNDRIEIGADAVVPTNAEPGNYSAAVLGLGADLKPIPWLMLSAGLVGGGDYDLKIPVGICFIVGKGTYEAGIASRDAITFFTDRRPTLSICTGFLRFRF